MKLACYDAGGKPVIKTLTGGDELLAARTSLGCVGVILEITLELVPRRVTSSKRSPRRVNSATCANIARNCIPPMC